MPESFKRRAISNPVSWGMVLSVMMRSNRPGSRPPQLLDDAVHNGKSEPGPLTLRFGNVYGRRYGCTKKLQCFFQNRFELHRPEFDFRFSAERQNLADQVTRPRRSLKDPANILFPSAQARRKGLPDNIRRNVPRIVKSRLMTDRLFYFFSGDFFKGLIGMDNFSIQSDLQDHFRGMLGDLLHQHHHFLNNEVLFRVKKNQPRIVDDEAVSLFYRVCCLGCQLNNEFRIEGESDHTDKLLLMQDGNVEHDNGCVKRGTAAGKQRAGNAGLPLF